MKRAIVAALIVLSMIPCVACENAKKENNMIEYESGNFYDTDYSESIGTYNSAAVIPNEETALKVATAIFDGMEKSQLFKTVICDGALPRKTFSMGHAADKRYYLECRKIK